MNNTLNTLLMVLATVAVSLVILYISLETSKSLKTLEQKAENTTWCLSCHPKVHEPKITLKPSEVTNHATF